LSSYYITSNTDDDNTYSNTDRIEQEEHITDQQQQQWTSQTQNPKISLEQPATTKQIYKKRIYKRHHRSSKVHSVLTGVETNYQIIW
jgi:hypothetical protein